ncbi:MAG: hypothetical protein NTW57_00285 [Methylophilales bacterium]|nr:hypothetical protein [Methylophilales bacterium]
MSLPRSGLGKLGIVLHPTEVASDFSASFNREQDRQNYDRNTSERYRREERQENNAIVDELKKSNEYGSEE